MARTRGATAERTAAMKAAKAHLQNTMVGVIGQLADAKSAVGLTRETIANAKQEGDLLVAQARQQAEQLMSKAQEQNTTAQQAYETSYEAALEAGWSARALKDLGYSAQRSPRKTRQKEPTQNVAKPDQPVSIAADSTNESAVFAA